MDGKQLLRALRDLLNESSDSGWWDEYSAYNYLYQAACEFVDRTGCLRESQDITTVADTASYRLNADFKRMYLRNSSRKFYIKVNDGSNSEFITHKPYEEIYYANNTTSIPIPSNFAIIDDQDPPDAVSGTATANGAKTNGQCTLTDAAGDFTDISAGDAIHNTTDSSMGVVLSVTSGTVLVAAMFDGTDNDFDNGDAYYIVPQPRYKIVLDPAPSVAGYTLTVPYVQKPAPVYSDFGRYRIPWDCTDALANWAFWRFKYRDSNPNFGDKAYVFFDNACKRQGNFIGNKLNDRSRMRVNAKVRD